MSDSAGLKSSAGTSKDIIRLENLEKWYGKRCAVKIDSLTLAEGDRVLLTGMNGSGKSTLLRLLAGVSFADSGELWKAPGLKQVPLGYVPQSGGLYSSLSVRHNLFLRCFIYGVQALDPEDAWYVRDLGLTPFLDTHFEALSTGYQQLATLAATLHTDPQWLLLDEPFSGIDDAKRQVLEESLARVVEEMPLVVIASPAPEKSFPANRVVQLEEGGIV